MPRQPDNADSMSAEELINWHKEQARAAELRRENALDVYKHDAARQARRASLAHHDEVVRLQSLLWLGCVPKIDRPIREPVFL